MYVKVLSRSDNPDDVEDEDQDDIEDIDHKDAKELFYLFRVSSELKTVLTWEKAPYFVHRYINTGGDEDIYGIACEGVVVPSSFAFASSMITRWYFYDIDHSFLGVGFVCHHA